MYFVFDFIYSILYLWYTSRLLHICNLHMGVICSFLLLYNIFYMKIPEFIFHFTIDEHLCGFQFVAITNNADMNIGFSYFKIIFQTYRKAIRTVQKNMFSWIIWDYVVGMMPPNNLEFICNSYKQWYFLSFSFSPPSPL